VQHQDPERGDRAYAVQRVVVCLRPGPGALRTRDRRTGYEGCHGLPPGPGSEAYAQVT
jgi:hypothetical protein